LLQIWNGIALGSNLFLDTPSLDAADASVGTLGYSSEIVGRIGRSCIASFASSCSIAALFSRGLLPLCTLALLQHCFSPAVYGCASDMTSRCPASAGRSKFQPSSVLSRGLNSLRWTGLGFVPQLLRISHRGPDLWECLPEHGRRGVSNCIMVFVGSESLSIGDRPREAYG